eukprot:scpid45861/ scgid22105/ 
MSLQASLVSGFARRMMKSAVSAVGRARKGTQSLKLLFPVTLVVLIFTLYTLVKSRSDGTDSPQALSLRTADQQEESVRGGRPLPKPNHMSRKLLIEMVKSKGLWTDTTRRPVMQSFRERIQRASLHAINRSREIEQQRKEQENRTKPFEYWNIGGENLRFAWNQSDGGGKSWVSVLKDISEMNGNVNGDKPWKEEGSAKTEKQEEMSERKNVISGVAHVGRSRYPLRNDEILYFVKTAGKFESRAKALYDSWGKLAHRLIISTDSLLIQSDIPAWKQRVAHLNQMGRILFHGPHALSCATTCLNLAKVLQEEEYYDTKWVVFLDDDTFVIPQNLLAYLSEYDPEQMHYLGLSIPEPIAWLPRLDNGKPVHMAATSAGAVFSRGLMQHIRHNIVETLQLTKIHERCVRARMGDDVALGLLAVENKVELVSRPDLVGFHWSDRPTPKGIDPLTIHLQLQMKPNDIPRFSDLSEKYINASAMARDFGDDVLKRFL